MTRRPGPVGRAYLISEPCPPASAPVIARSLDRLTEVMTRLCDLLSTQVIGKNGT